MEKYRGHVISHLVGIVFIGSLCLGVNAQTRSTVPRIVMQGWYKGDMHVHRNCGDRKEIISDNKLTELMEKNGLDVVSMLADMGSAVANDSKEDLQKVNGKDAKESIPGRIIRWDAEWHYDPGVTSRNNFIGGHLALLGLKEARHLKDESPYKILEWAKKQSAITGFVHMEYLNDSIQNNLNCRIPVDYPVEAALCTIDFVAEDNWQNDAAIHAYYKLLNCGFRIGLAAGTDVPCMNGSIGDILTYVQVKDLPLTYEKWINGIKDGRTVVSLNGNNEFLDLRANSTNTPGDEIKIKGQGDVNVMVRWSVTKELTGRIELICNGKVVATQAGTAKPGSSVVLSATQKFIRSGWLCARRMDEKGHISHTAPIYVSVDNHPIRASIDDAKYFISWIDNVLANISSGDPGNKYFIHDLDTVKARYEKARDIYIRIQDETLDQLKNMGNGVLDNGSVVKSPVKKTVKHKSKSYRKK